MIILNHVVNCWPILAISRHPWHRKPESHQARGIESPCQSIRRSNVIFNDNGDDFRRVCFEKNSNLCQNICGWCLPIRIQSINIKMDRQLAQEISLIRASIFKFILFYYKISSQHSLNTKLKKKKKVVSSNSLNFKKRQSTYQIRQMSIVEISLSPIYTHCAHARHFYWKRIHRVHEKVRWTQFKYITVFIL